MGHRLYVMAVFYKHRDDLFVLRSSLNWIVMASLVFVQAEFLLTLLVFIILHFARTIPKMFLDKRATFDLTIGFLIRRNSKIVYFCSCVVHTKYTVQITHQSAFLDCSGIDSRLPPRSFLTPNNVIYKVHLLDDS